MMSLLGLSFGSNHKSYCVVYSINVKRNRAISSIPMNANQVGLVLKLFLLTGIVRRQKKPSLFILDRNKPSHLTNDNLCCGSHQHLIINLLSKPGDIIRQIFSATKPPYTASCVTGYSNHRVSAIHRGCLAPLFPRGRVPVFGRHSEWWIVGGQSQWRFALSSVG